MQGLKFIPNWFASLTDAIAEGTVGEAAAVNDCRQVGWFVKRTGTVSGGTVIIEWAPEIDYANEWNTIGSMNLANLATGACGGTWPGPIGFIRARIPTGAAVTGGGSVTVLFNGLRG